jgi:glutathione S-transferase
MVRITLNDLGIAYEDSYPSPDWPTFKAENTANGKLTFGQVPLFEDEDGTAIVQSQAILRHLARKHKAYGSTEAEMTMVDVCVDGAADWRRNYSKLVYTDNLAPEALATYKASLLGAGGGMVPHFEKIISSNAAGFVAASTITIADYSLFDVVDNNIRIIPELFDEAKSLKAWYDMMSARPNLAKYIASNPEHRAKVNGNGLG